MRVYGGEELKNLARRLYEAGFNIVPVLRKRPLLSWGSRRRAGWGEIEKALGRADGLALVAGPANPFGRVSDLLIIDIDDPRKAEESPLLRRLLSESVSWRTGPRCPRCLAELGPGAAKKDVACRGGECRHELCGRSFRLEEAPRGLAIAVYIDKGALRGTRRLGPIELMANNYQLIPPSRHPSGVRYEWVRPPDFDSPSLGIYSMVPEELEQLINEFSTQSDAEEDAKEVCGEWRRLGEAEIRQIVDTVKPYYRPGQRHIITMSMLGWMIKNCIDKESAREVVERLAEEAGDEEVKQRIYQVEYHYTRRLELAREGKLKGASGLREAIYEQLAREKGEEEAEAEAAGVLHALEKIVGARGAAPSAWIRIVDGRPVAFVVAKRGGVYLVRKADDAVSMQIITRARIDSARHVELVGLGDMPVIYEVVVDGVKVSGAMAEVLGHIKRYKGLGDGDAKYVAVLIDKMASSEGAVERFYSPGPWLVGERLLMAEEAGYLPPWKPRVKWEPPREIDEGKVRRALEALKRLVEAYRAPQAASAVLSYAAVAPFALEVKKRLGYFPHLLVSGLNEAGKSVLLDTIEELYRAQASRTPRTDFQARVLLAESKLPALIHEFRAALESEQAMDVLMRAATQIEMARSGGQSYGGIFLAVRSVIAATNADVSLPPEVADKFITVALSREQGIDPAKAQGATPKTMDSDTLAGLGMVGVALLEEASGAVKELGSGSRREIKQRMLEAGYGAWRRLYERHGLEPFPAPQLREEEYSVEDMIRDAFLEFVNRSLKGDVEPQLLVVEEGMEDEALRGLHTAGAVIIDKGGCKELLAKTTFLSRFKEFAAKEYGLPRLGWRRIAELLAMKKTTRKIAGKAMWNLVFICLEQ